MITAATIAAAIPDYFAAAFLQAQQAGQDINWVTYLLNGGPFAIVLLLIIFDKIGTHAERDRLRSENTILREKNEELNTTLREDVVPPLTQLTGLMADVLRRLDDDPPPPPRRR